MRDREGDAQSSPWDILISVKLFLDGTKTEVCFPRGPPVLGMTSYELIGACRYGHCVMAADEYSV